MSKPQTVKEWTAYIYDKLSIAERTNSWVAEGLQKIEAAYEQMEHRNQDLLVYQHQMAWLHHRARDAPDLKQWLDRIPDE